VNFPGAPCFKGNTILKKTDVNNLKEALLQNFDYLIWDQHGWKNIDIKNISFDLEKHFFKLREWPSERYGKLILYEVVK